LELTDGCHTSGRYPRRSCEVVASAHPGFAVGDKVTGMLGTQEYSVATGSDLTKVGQSMEPLPTWLGGSG
jgi:NADPH-dependent curcumin reductase CurA